jgi:hypothetical protein
MADDATKKNRGCFTIALVRLVILISAAVLYLRGRLTLTKPGAA